MSSASMLAPIVVAEDSPDDLFFLEHSLKQAGIENPVLAFDNGEKTIRFLERIDLKRPEIEPSRPPCLILLDIKMPLMSGLEVLEWARKQPSLAHIPIVMLSGSTAASDKARAQELGALAYLVKPAMPEDLASIARRTSCSGAQG